MSCFYSYFHYLLPVCLPPSHPSVNPLSGGLLDQDVTERERRETSTRHTVRESNTGREIQTRRRKMETTPWPNRSHEWGRRWCVTGVSLTQLSHLCRKLFCFFFQKLLWYLFMHLQYIERQYKTLACSFKSMCTPVFVFTELPVHKLH